VTAYPSPNFGARRGGVRPSLIVLHYTAMASVAEARERLCNQAFEVSAHWLIGEDGGAEQLVDEAQRAWHAGAGEWAGKTDVNSHSIGIELANTGFRPYPEAQMAGLEGVLRAVMDRWRIAPQGIIAHSDMAPARKSDPGPKFDWRRLARQGLSVWPLAQEADLARFYRYSRRFGYPEVPPDMLLRAFRLRFRPWAKGPLDRVDAGMARDLAERFGVDSGRGSA
jgi:N-acetylmuramoyl-L-alanine amidase